MSQVRDRLFQPGQTRVKICGVTNAADAAQIVEAGADAIGINLFPGSKRFVDLYTACEWLQDVAITRVAVVVNATSDDLMRIVATSCFDAVQFHGDERPEFCAMSPLPWIRAVRVSGAEVLNTALDYVTQTLMLDGYTASSYGGTGVTVDCELAAEFVRMHKDRQVILAGGLRPETVARAMHIVSPHGVDVAGGVEVNGEPRRKDAAKVHAFVEAVREA